MRRSFFLDFGLVSRFKMNRRPRFFILSNWRRNSLMAKITRDFFIFSPNLDSVVFVFESLISVSEPSGENNPEHVFGFLCAPPSYNIYPAIQLTHLSLQRRGGGELKALVSTIRKKLLLADSAVPVLFDI
jgi:hypothetical protein